MHERFLLLFFNVLIEYSRVDLGAGISFDGYSIDDGKTWYLECEGKLILEEDFMLGWFVHNSLGCCCAAKLS